VLVVPFVLSSHLGRWHLAIAMAAWGLTLAAAVLRRLPVPVRVWLLAGSVGLYAGAMLARGGVFLHFRPTLLSFPLVVVLLAGVRRGLAVGVAHVLFAVVAYRATEAGWLPQGPPPWEQGEWILQAAGTVGAAVPPLLLLAWFSHHVTTTIRSEFLFAERLRAEAADRERLEGEVLEAGERESRRLGAELHDGVCQDLTGLLIRAKRTQKALAAGERPEAEALGAVVQGLGEAIGEIHDLSRRLSPGRLSGQELAGALADLVRRTAETAALALSFQATGERPPLDTAATLHLYRIAQEALSNAVRHARATHVAVRLSHDGSQTTLSVEDDGVGLPDDATTPRGLGLDTMRWRAAKAGGALTLVHPESGGLRVLCRVPLPGDQDEEARHA
jgi:signal transduction histidine kinase